MKKALWILTATLILGAIGLNAAVAPSPTVAPVAAATKVNPRGTELYARLGCAACHGEEAEGGPNAPSLRGLGSRHGRDWVARAVRSPAEEIANGYEQVSITTTEGGMISGRLIAETDDGVELRVKGKGKVRLARARIEEMARSPGSDMPDGLADDLTEQEFDDLLAYLLSR